MSTGLSITETSSGPEVAAGRSPRRKTSHLKEVPETLELRESLRARCDQIAGRLDRTVPMTKDEVEQIARAALEEADLPEAYLGWMMVMISSAFWKTQLASVPHERRLFLLPHCLKHAEGCPADYDQFGMNCKKCGASQGQIAPAKQAEYKLGSVQAVFREYAGCLPARDPELVASPRLLNYRNKMEYSFTLDDAGRISLALHQRQSYRFFYALESSRIARERLTALIGVDNLVVVQAEGATLVCHKDRAQDVKKMVALLEAKGGYDALL